MALDNGGTGKVSVAASSSINSLAAFTRLLWVWFDTFVEASGFTGKGSASTRKQLITENLNARFVMETVASSGNFVTRALYANYTPAVVTGKWLCVATSVDVGVSSSGKIYAGDLSALVAEPSSYATQAGTAGTATDDSASPLTIGVDGDGDAASDAKFAVFGLWNRVLTLTELQAQQRCLDLVVPSGCVVWLNLEPIDLGGLDTQTDVSGQNNHGTPTATTYVGHVPLGRCAPRPSYESFPKAVLRAPAGGPV